MDTPAGFEFVPGLDDSGESLEYLSSRNSTDSSIMGGRTSTTKDREDYLDTTAEEKCEEFLEEVQEDYELLTHEQG